MVNRYMLKQSTDFAGNVSLAVLPDVELMKQGM